jgi:ribonuclease HI
MYHLYSDGGCQPNPGDGGWAFVIHTDGKQTHCDSGYEANTTNNRMELRAVKEGLAYLEGLGVEGAQVVLVSDSMYLIKSIDLWVHNWRRNGWINAKKEPVKNRDLLEAIMALRVDFDMVCRYVKGHSGHPENELCDRMAVSARLRK